MVALYPLMKRITWWPQVWLGLTFNWGVLVASARGSGRRSRQADAVLYGALVFWTLGYDTIYAIQDREDDALIGVRSTARRFGDHIKPAITVIYVPVHRAGGACRLYRACRLEVSRRAPQPVAPFALHLIQQAIRLDPGNGDLALSLFRANRDAGVLLFAGWAFIAARDLTDSAPSEPGDGHGRRQQSPRPDKKKVHPGSDGGSGRRYRGCAVCRFHLDRATGTRPGPPPRRMLLCSSPPPVQHEPVAQTAQFGQDDPAVHTAADASSRHQPAPSRLTARRINFCGRDADFQRSASRPAPQTIQTSPHLRKDAQNYLASKKAEARSHLRGVQEDRQWFSRLAMGSEDQMGLQRQGRRHRQPVRLVLRVRWRGPRHDPASTRTSPAPTAQQLTVADMLEGGLSPAVVIAICEALKVEKQNAPARRPSSMNPITCAGPNANVEDRRAKLVLAPSDQAEQVRRRFTPYYEPYEVGAYVEGSYDRRHPAGSLRAGPESQSSSRSSRGTAPAAKGLAPRPEERLQHGGRLFRHHARSRPSGREWQVGCSKKRGPFATAPPFSSAAPVDQRARSAHG